jgi:cell volume regulation protein A
VPAKRAVHAVHGCLMSLTLFFGLLGGLLVLAFVANRLVRRTGIPDVLVLMATGVALGPVFHLVDPSKFAGVTHGFGTLALILILFEAGLELDLWQTLRHFPGGFLLAVFSHAFSMLLIAAVAQQTLSLPLRSAMIVGAVLGGVSSSVTLPVLQHLQLRPKVRTTLMIEASMADILSVLAVAVLLGLPASGVAVFTSLVQGFVRELGISLLFGVAAGIGWSFLLPALSDQRFWQVLTFGAVLVLYAVTAVAGGGSLFAVLVFGLTLTNIPEVRKRITLKAPSPATGLAEPHVSLLAFHAELSFLVRTFFFVLIGVVVRFSAFFGQWIAVVGMFGTILLGRWLAVEASRLAWRDTQSWERELAFWLLPRGLITAVLALEVARVLGGGWDFLLDLSFAAIVLTNLCLLVGTLRARRRTQVSKLEEAAPPVEL